MRCKESHHSCVPSGFLQPLQGSDDLLSLALGELGLSGAAPSDSQGATPAPQGGDGSGDGNAASSAKETFDFDFGCVVHVCPKSPVRRHPL
jgi:hypothetical protein